MSDKRAKKNISPVILYRILQSPCNKRLINLRNFHISYFPILYDVHSIWISEGIVLPNMELLTLQGFCKTYIIYTALLFFPGEDRDRYQISVLRVRYQTSAIVITYVYIIF